MNRIGIAEVSLMVGVLILLGIMAGCLQGCRTYYVYQFGTGDNEILVEAEVLKELNPQVKASLK